MISIVGQDDWEITYKLTVLYSDDNTINYRWGLIKFYCIANTNVMMKDNK